MAKKKKIFDKLIPEKKKLTEKYIFYMLPTEVPVKEIEEIIDLESEIWSDINVMEIQLPNHNMVYFEWLDHDSWGEEDKQFLKNNGIIMVYGVIYFEEDCDKIVPYFHKIIDKCGGFMCEDNDSFDRIIF